jgi:uncharacterized protein (DUF1697 family)
MSAIVALFRAVNIGGKAKLEMAALRELLSTQGLEQVRTYIQSGNAVFRSGKEDLAATRSRIEEAVERRFGFRPAVILRTLQEIREVVAKNPFAGRAGLEPAKLLVVFLDREANPSEQERVLRIEADPEEFVLRGKELYIYYPDGMGRSKLPYGTFEKALTMAGTGRNWNTVLKLREMAETLEETP